MIFDQDSYLAMQVDGMPLLDCHFGLTISRIKIVNISGKAVDSSRS